MIAVRDHVFIPDPGDVRGQACRVCPLSRSNAVHVDPAEVPVDDRYEKNESTETEEGTL